MSIQWTRVLYSIVITRQSIPPISQFNSLCNELTSFWSMFVYNMVDKGKSTYAQNECRISFKRPGKEMLGSR